MQKKCKNICVCQKKAVLLHSRLRNNGVYRGVEQW